MRGCGGRWYGGGQDTIHALTRQLSHTLRPGYEREVRNSDRPSSFTSGLIRDVLDLNENGLMNGCPALIKLSLGQTNLHLMSIKKGDQK